ncbi:MAG: glycosyltransferase family 2 protein [Alphaproteobacteria bacterium]
MIALIRKQTIIEESDYWPVNRDHSTFVSILIPAFNRGFVIRETLESIRSQTYGNWEAIVVNDGSSDDTSEAVEECAKRDSRVYLIEHGRQKGAQAARNTALRAARGDWIAFLDSDDRWLPHSLALRLKAAVKGAHVVHSECYVLEAQGDHQLFGVPPFRGWVYRELLRSPGPMFQSLLLSREACSRLGWLDENIVAYQEWDTSIRLAKHYSFEFVAEPTFIYDCRHANTISKDALREAVGYEQVVNKHCSSILRYLGPKTLAYHYQKAASFYMKANQEEHANRCSLRAALCWPFKSGLISGGKKHFVKVMWKKWDHAHRNSS